MEDIKEITTLKDLADLLGLSPSTVSRALQNSSAVKEETRVLIQETARKYNFEPNEIASNLRRARSQTIGILVPKVSNYFYSAAIEGIEDEAYRLGYKVLICQSNESFEKEVMNTKALLTSRVDGVLAAVSLETNQYDHFSLLASKSIPVVFFNRVPQHFAASKVYSDDLKGAINATRHLLMTGCQRLAHLTGPHQLSLTRNRLNGFRQTLEEVGAPVIDELIIEAGTEMQGGFDAMIRALEQKNRPDGVLAFNDRVAIGAVKAIKSRGLRIPEDISIIGFSNSPSSTIVEPNLTTIEQSGLEVGKRAFHILMSQINKESAGIQIGIVDTRLIIRDSTKKA